MNPVYLLWATPRSTSLACRQPRKPVGADDLPARLRVLYDDFLPHYQHLHAHRLPPNVIP